MNEPRPVPAPAYGSAIRLKRAKTSLSDVEIVDSDLRARGPTPSIGSLPKQDVVARKRSRRGFSLNKLTTSLGLQNSTRQRIDKASISRPIVDCQSVVSVSPSSLQLGQISPTSHTSHFLHANTSPARGHSQGFATYSKQLPAKDICRFHNNDITQKVGKMDASRLSLQPPATGTKLRQRQAAQEMQNLVIERARRSGEDPPPYDFFELIGRGSFGRVFKGTDRKTGETVAIKILDIDSSDYIERSQDQLSSTLKEISILQQLRDSKARPYVNVIMEALPVHNELWIISEYASGGSVSTLMKPNANKGLDEKFIIPIARELAWALKYTHEIGILHRDLKCANILILEDGRVQLCDFGVSGIVEARQAEPSKRFSVHGTPHWLAPELIPPLINNEFETELPYGPEVDIWAYACTVYEMATGRPPNATTAAINLPNAPLPTLEGGPYSQDLKDFVDFLFVRDPENRPTIDQILEHPYLVNSTKMYPTVMLVKLLEDYTQWERAGGSRISLIDPKAGAPAPDPLAPDDDDDDDWTFSTSEDFETRLSRAFPEQFGMPDQNQDGLAYDSGQGQDRFANLMEIWKQERIARGKEGLERLFNPNADPYRWDNSNGRPPSDLVLRDYHPGAPNRETVIDLDFAAPVAADGRSIDLGDVSHIKANRRYLRDSHLENENSDIFDMDAMMKRATQEWKFPSSEDQDLTVKRATQDWKFPLNEEITKRATKDWKFPMTEESLKRATREMKLPVNEEALKRATKDWKFPMTEEALKRATQDWKFPPMPEQPNRQTKDFQFPPPAKNRATREWTFSAAIAEANYNQRNSRRETRDWKLSTAAPAEQPINRKTRDFVFPMSETVEDEADDGQHIQSSPTLESNFRPTLRHAATEPASSFDDYPRVDSTPNSPLRSSMIDLDMAVVDDYRPPSAGSASTTIRTAMSEQLHDNPFNLEDQVHLSENNNRTSYHTKSQSEPNHAIPGLLTPQTYDEQGQPTNPDSHHQNMHARGVSSVSQMQAQLKPPNTNNAITQHRPYQRSQAQIWDGWSHSAAYNTGSDESPPASVVTDMSVDDEDIDEAWDTLEKQTIFRNRYQIPGATHHQTTASRGGGGVEDDVHYADADYDDPARLIRVSLGPNGKPLVEFPIPRGPDPEALLGINGIGDGNAKLEDALWKSAAEIRDGVRACRDLMKAMRLVEGADDDETSHLTNGNGTDISATVRLSRADR